MKIFSVIAVVVFAGCTGVGERSTTQQLCTANPNNPCCPGSPIIVDLAGDGIRLTSAEDGVVFQLRPGRFALWAWPERGSDDAFLALDVNGDGRIGDGSELFGDGSIQIASAAPNGFMALAYYDSAEQGGNGDGVIDARDAVWPRLRLWRDADHDAFSAPGELRTLAEAGVHSFSLDVTPTTAVDGHGNEFRFSSTIVADLPVSRTVSDVWLVQTPLPLPADEIQGRQPRDYIQWTCWAWGYAVEYSASTGNGIAVCDLPNVQNDPIATTALGVLSRLVARFSVSTTKDTAMNRAYDITLAAITTGAYAPHFCHTYGFPTPDLYYPAPYDRETVVGTTEIRVKCIAQTITSGGGGGGC